MVTGRGSGHSTSVRWPLAAADVVVAAVDAAVAVDRVEILRNQFLVLFPAAAAAIAAVIPRLATSTLFDRPVRSTSRRPPANAVVAGRLSVVLLPLARPVVDCNALLADDLSEFIMDCRSVLVQTIPDDLEAAATLLLATEPGGSSDARRLAGMGGAIFSDTSMFEYLLASLNLKTETNFNRIL